jgi:hypothetical protein
MRRCRPAQLNKVAEGQRASEALFASAARDTCASQLDATPAQLKALGERQSKRQSAFEPGREFSNP